MPVTFTTVKVPSSWGVSTWNRLIQHQPTSSTLTVLFPGATYPCEGPLLWYAREGAVRVGADALALEYGYSAAHVEPDFDADRPRIVDDAIASVQKVIAGTHYRSLLFVSKSIGTYMAVQAAKRMASLPVRHLFLTPIRSAVPLMLELGGVVVVGDVDHALDSEQLARISSAQNLAVTMVPGADHSLEIDGDIAGSLRVLEQVYEVSARLARAEQADPVAEGTQP